MQDYFDNRKDTRPCEVCGLVIPLKTSKRTRDSTPGGQFLCKICARVCLIFLFLLKAFIQVLLWNIINLALYLFCNVYILIFFMGS